MTSIIVLIESNFALNRNKAIRKVELVIKCLLNMDEVLRNQAPHRYQVVKRIVV